MKLLNGPTNTAFFFGGTRIQLIEIIGDDIIRPVGRHQYAEQFEASVGWHLVDFDEFTLLNFLSRPTQVRDRLVRLCATRIIHFPIALNGAVEGFLLRHQPFKEVGDGIPAIHQHGLIANLTGSQLVEHLQNVVNLALAILIGVKDAVVNEPELVGGRIEIHAVDYANALDDTVGVARVLAANQLNFMAVFFIEDGIIKQHVPIGTELDLVTDLLPYLAGRKAAGLEEVLHIVVSKALEMLGQISARVIDLAAEQKLAVELSGDFQCVFIQVNPFA